MKLLQTSDTHIGISTEGQIKVMLREAAKTDFDVLVHCGDYCGTELGWKCVKKTVEQIRKVFPDKAYVSVLGNHDYWCKTNKKTKIVNSFGEVTYKTTRPHAADYLVNLENIIKIFKDNDVHFLDRDGVYIHPDFTYAPIIGASGWYTNPNPPTTDYMRLPLGLEGDTNRFLLKETERRLFETADEQLRDFDPSWQSLVFVSHFPVIKGEDYKGRFEDFSWGEYIANYFIEKYGCKYFLNGHSHQTHDGPLRYECGSDYHNPKAKIVEVY